MLLWPQPSAPASSNTAYLLFMLPSLVILRRGAAAVPSSTAAQQQLDAPAEPLERRLARQRLAPVADLLQPRQLDGQPPARVLDRTPPVSGEAALDVVGGAGVEGPVGAAQQVHPPH